MKSFEAKTTLVKFWEQFAFFFVFVCCLHWTAVLPIPKENLMLFFYLCALSLWCVKTYGGDNDFRYCFCCRNKMLILTREHYFYWFYYRNVFIKNFKRNISKIRKRNQDDHRNIWNEFHVSVHCTETETKKARTLNEVYIIEYVSYCSQYLESAFYNIY